MRLFFATLLAFAALASTASAATPGVNVNSVPLSEAGWAKVADSHAKTIRVWAFMSEVESSPGVLSTRATEYRAFADRARTYGASTVITLMSAPGSATPPDPAAYARVAQELALFLKGHGVIGYEVWNEPDDAPYWHPAPSAAAYAALLRAAYPAFKAGDPSALVSTGGMVANDYDFLQALYDNGAKGSFDAVGVHTDNACLTTDPREYYREPSGRIGRYSFTGYREVRATMLAHGDDKPVWMTELGWPTITTTCTRGGRAGTKAAGVTPAEQADFLTKAYGCLANDPYVPYAAWFSLSDVQTGSPDDSLNLGLMNDAFARKPAFAAFQAAAGAAPIACGGVMDSGVPQVTVNSPTDGQFYVSTLPVDITATDDQGVTDIDVFVDGKEIPLKTNKSGKGAYIRYDWGGAKNLSYGPHTLVVTAGDEAKNVARVTSKVVHVGGGKYPYKVPTSYTLKVGKVKGGKVTVRGRIASRNPLISRLAHGRGYVHFQRFDTKAKRWKTMSKFSRDAKKAFSVRYTFKKRGVWRVTGHFKPKTGFKAARAKASKKFRV